MTDTNSITTNIKSKSLPAMPDIESIMWRPSEQTSPVFQSESTDRLMLYADADSHTGDDWKGYVPDIPNAANPTGGSVLLAYWDGTYAEYTLTLRSYWRLIPDSFTHVGPGTIYERVYTTTSGISTADSNTLSAELGVGVEGLSAKISASFSQEVTTSSETTQSTTYTVNGPTNGSTRVWMLWQLVDEIIALDKTTKNMLVNTNRHGYVNWQHHAPSGAWLSYQNVRQLFPTNFIIPAQKDFIS